MGMDSILKLVANISRTDAGSTMESSMGIGLPRSAADPSAVAEFSKVMDQGVNTEIKSNGVTSAQNVHGIPEVKNSHALTSLNDAGYANPATLGEKLSSASPATGFDKRINQTETSSTKEWLNTITDIFDKETLSFPDLYRVQMLAGMAQIETTRNSSVGKSMDDSLKTLIKNT